METKVKGNQSRNGLSQKKKKTPSIPNSLYTELV